jgi:hypothetical protein
VRLEGDDEALREQQLQSGGATNTAGPGNHEVQSNKIWAQIDNVKETRGLSIPCPFGISNNAMNRLGIHESYLYNNPCPVIRHSKRYVAPSPDVLSHCYNPRAVNPRVSGMRCPSLGLYRESFHTTARWPFEGYYSCQRRTSKLSRCRAIRSANTGGSATDFPQGRDLGNDSVDGFDCYA